MEFKDLILNNIGRDMYICIENESGERYENIINRYNIIKSKMGSDLIQSAKSITNVEICLDAELLFHKEKKRTKLIDIEAAYKTIKYHMYISDCICESLDDVWKKQISSLNTLAREQAADKTTTLG